MCCMNTIIILQIIEIILFTFLNSPTEPCNFKTLINTVIHIKYFSGMYNINPSVSISAPFLLTTQFKKKLLFYVS